MNRAPRRSHRLPRPLRFLRHGSVSAFALLAPLIFLLLAAPAFAAQTEPPSGPNTSAQQILVDALSAACRQSAPGFSRFLLADSRRVFDGLPEAEQKIFLKRFSLTSLPGRPRALLDAEGHIAVQCLTPAETVNFSLGPARIDHNVAFVPVAVSSGGTVEFGLVRQPQGWRLFSLDLLVINVPALVQQWLDAEMHVNQQAAAADLLDIARAIRKFHAAFGQWPTTLAQLGPSPSQQVSPEHAQLLPAKIASGATDGYRFRYRVVTGSGGHIQGFELGAVPGKYGKTGRQSFFVDEQGKLHAADHRGGPATDSDPIVPPPAQNSSP